MRRRELLAVFGAGLTVSPVSAWTQTSRVYRLGILETIPADRNAANLAALRRGLQEHGYTDFQLPTISAPTMAPSAMSVSRDNPRHMTVLPGGGSLARAR